ncbi:MAG: hypothetical protein U9Q87_05270 [Pseudomonadota bacterium]|nr:hypothetical protein [Pseudomonadota bacterium]
MMNYENLFNISWALLICSSLLCVFGLIVSFKYYGGDCRMEPRLFHYFMKVVSWIWLNSIVAAFGFGAMVLGS